MTSLGTSTHCSVHASQRQICKNYSYAHDHEQGLSSLVCCNQLVHTFSSNMRVGMQHCKLLMCSEANLCGICMLQICVSGELCKPMSRCNSVLPVQMCPIGMLQHGITDASIEYDVFWIIEWVCRGTPEGPCVQKFASLAEARECGGLEIVFNQQ